MERQCEKCGQCFTPRSSRQVLCIKCALKTKQKPKNSGRAYQKVCEVCGASFVAKANHAKFCPRHSSRKKQKEETIQTGKCAVCGRDYEKKRVNAKYCVDCRAKVERAACRARERKQIEADRAYLQRARERWHIEKKCKRCFKPLKDGETDYCSRCKEIIEYEKERPIAETFCTGCIYWRDVAIGYKGCHMLLDTGKMRDKSNGVHTCGSKKESGRKGDE